MIIIPALLEKKSEELIEIAKKFQGVTPWLQIDFADGSMSGNVTCDLYDLVGELDGFDLEIHLMTTHPENYFDACDILGAKRVYFHLGEVESPNAVLRAMDPYDFTKGIALSPQTGVEDLFVYIDEIDAVQIMTVVPGKQGNVYMPEMLDKVTYVRERRTDLWIAVDGGVNEETIPEIKIRGVDAVGIGSALMGAKDVVQAYRKLQKMIQ
jgi:ribulose-phosphate 3-epimerase